MSLSLLGHAAASVLLSAAPSTPMADVFVDAANANCATGTGALGSPVCSITTAIGLALPGDTIRIAPGTYVENVVIGIDLDLIAAGGASVTTIDGGALGSVVEISAGVTVMIDGLTITNGLAGASSGASAGGGGGIFLGVDGTLTLSNSTITGNSTTLARDGGGIHAPYRGSLTVTSCLLANNLAAYGGGGIRVRNGTCVISDSVITGNTANKYGGGVYFAGQDDALHTLTIADSTISNNAVTGGGGGYTRGYGAGIGMVGGSFMMTGSTLSGNSALRSGGGLFSYGADFAVANSTFSGNSASVGGGIYAWSGGDNFSLSNVTVSENNGTINGGGGVWNWTSNPIENRNTIIAGNTAPGGGSDSIDTFGPFMSLGSNLIGEGGTGFTNGVLGDIAGTSAVPIDALLGPLQDNGGPTETHAPMLGSPALDAGDALVFEAVDQRGVARPLGAGPDIGSVEGFLGPTVAFCFGDGSGTSCPCANNSTPGHAGGCANSLGDGAILDVSGVASVSSDSLNLDLSSASQNTFAVLVSGFNQLPQMGACIGCGLLAFDGLRCAGGGSLRHGSRATNALGETGNGWGTPGGPANGLIAANAFNAGETRHFFAFYRDNLSLVCMTGWNTSNGISVTFQP